MSNLSRRQILILAASISGVGARSPIAVAQQAKPGSSKRVALGGYDPVSYFDPGRPEQGSPQFSFDFDDAVYRFKSAEHMAKFVADPERYAPQYAGYCAITLAAGNTAEADPEAWSISNGKLYVFGAKEGARKFNANASVIVDTADANWKKIHEAK
ncbi:YHS domain-containing (seleno)protein [Bradyrhizobium sp.]|uniref:YHS domain-containing (seleno)protein n=1 Tax=Bradyrhizobium sp. TaxID=376 RepID=UPI003C7936F3